MQDSTPHGPIVPLFGVGAFPRPTTPPPPPTLSTQTMRSPLSFRQPQQTLPSSPTRHDVPADPILTTVPVTDARTSIDWKNLPPKMAEYCKLFVVGKGGWGDGWVKCVEGFVKVEMIDGSPVRLQNVLIFLLQC